MPEDPKLTRCLRVLDALHQRGEIATREVMALLAVDRQTAMRDLRSLRASGVPIVPVGHGSRRRYRLEPAPPTEVGEAERVVLRSDPATAERIGQHRWPTFAVSEIGDGRVEIHMVGSDSAIRHVVFCLASKIEVLGPPRLREAVRTELERALAAYR